jgi:hypothetical protein
MGIGASVPGVTKPKPPLVLFAEVDAAEANGDMSEYPMLKSRKGTYIFDKVQGIFYDMEGNVILQAQDEMILGHSGQPICQIISEMEPDTKASAATYLSLMYGKGFEKRLMSLVIKNHEQVFFTKEVNSLRSNYVSLPKNQHNLEITYVGEKFSPSMFSGAKSKQIYRTVKPMDEMVIWRVNNTESDQGRVPVALLSKSMASMYTDRLTNLHMPNCCGLRIAPGVEQLVRCLLFSSLNALVSHCTLHFSSLCHCPVKIVFATILLVHKARNEHAFLERRLGFDKKKSVSKRWSARNLMPRKQPLAPPVSQVAAIG